jgi:hypothetical protein
VELDIDIGADARDWSAIQAAEKLKPVETELRRIEETVNEIVNEMEYLRLREQKLRDTNESTNERVKWFAFGKPENDEQVCDLSLTPDRDTRHACWPWSLAAGLSQVILPQQALDLSARRSKILRDIRRCIKPFSHAMFDLLPHFLAFVPA